MQNLLSLITLISLAQRIRSEWHSVTIEEEFATRPLLEYNFTETQATTAITTDITVDDEKFDDYELKKLFVKNFKLYTHSEKEGHNTKPHTSPRRKARAVANITGPFYGIECLLCYANGTTEQDERCYKGVKIPTKRCADAEYCFTEIHPLFLKRGCILPGRVNTTFVCNCPLCNDKPAKETIHYEYTRLSDWAYDNIRLTRPVIGLQLPCKVCETKGLNINLDNNCRSGKNTNYMVCGVNQICYTNIDDETDFVSRGCINSIVYNSIYYFCSSTLCNNVKFSNPKLILSQEEIQVKGKPSYLKRALNFDNLQLLSSDTSNSTLLKNDVILSKLTLILYFIISNRS